MDALSSFFAPLKPIIPMATTIGFFAVLMGVVHYLYTRRLKSTPNRNFRRQLIMLLLSILALLAVIVSSPLSDTQEGQLLSLIGIVLSAAMALSSTTFLGNAMAGIMLRAVKSFRMGDFVNVGDFFGRVSERGLFHTEIQTEYRDLITLPNLYLVTNPVRVVRSSGTIVYAEVSLGYDVPRQDVDRLLIEAAKTAELTDPFVHVLELGDFSVKYRVGGLLTEIKQLVSARSELREMILDHLHAGGVEIVSPNVMNTRAVPAGQLFIPKVRAAHVEPEPEPEVSAEDLAFDKAEEAESVEKLRMRCEELKGEIAGHERLIKAATTDEQRVKLTAHMNRLQAGLDRTRALEQERLQELEE